MYKKIFNRPLLVSILYLLLVMGVYAYAFPNSYGDSPPPGSSEDTLISSCLSFSGLDAYSPILITEVSFDGLDEWIELTNISPIDIYDTLTLSGAKSKPITLKDISIPAYSSLIIADNGENISGDVTILTGFGLSLPDTTGFTITITNTDQSIYDIVSFSPQQIQSIPDHYSIHNILQQIGQELFVDWKQVQPEYTINSTINANPGIIFCYYPTQPDSTDSGEVGDDGGNGSGDDTSNSSSNTGSTSDNTGSGTNTGDETTIDTGNTNNGNDNNNNTDNTDSNNTGGQDDSSNTSINTSGNQQTTIPLLMLEKCVISEVHSVSDVLPEYIEIHCFQSASGQLLMTGLSTGTTPKTIPFNLNTGEYLIVTSTISGFNDIGKIYTLPGISLRDDGEELLYQWKIQNNQSSGAISFPAIQKGQSYYPCLGVGQIVGVICKSVALPTPGYDTYFYDLYEPYFPTKIITQTTTSSSTSTSTYYQDLYKKRKETAETQEKTISELKKTISKLGTGTTTTGSTAKKTTATSTSTSTKTSATKKEPTPKSSTTSTKSTTKPTATTPKTTTSKTTTTKATTTKSTTSTSTTKAKTVSTTSKAYILLTNEHKLYKSYIDFLHTYLKSHLYTQYNSLQIPAVQEILKKSLQTAKKNSTIISYASGQDISIFDIATQRKVINQKSEISMDELVDQTYVYISKIVQSTKILYHLVF